MASKKLPNGNVEYGRGDVTKEYEPVHKRIARSRAADDFYTMACEPRIMELGTTGRWVITVCLEFLRGEGDRERVYQFYGTASIDIKDEDGMEKAETRAVGRALAFAGYPGETGIASQEDMERVVQREGANILSQTRDAMYTRKPAPAPSNVHNTAATAEPARPAPKSEGAVKEEVALVQLDLTGVRKLIKREIETGRAKHEPAGTVLSETQRASLPTYARWCGWADGEYAVLWQQSTGKTVKQFEQGATDADWVEVWNAVHNAMQEAVTVPVTVGA